MLGFFALMFFLAVGLLLVALTCLGLAAFLLPFSKASLIFSLCAVATFFGLFLFCILGSMIVIIGINKLYIEAEQQK